MWRGLLVVERTAPVVFIRPSICSGAGEVYRSATRCFFEDSLPARYGVAQMWRAKAAAETDSDETRAGRGFHQDRVADAETAADGTAFATRSKRRSASRTVEFPGSAKRSAPAFVNVPPARVASAESTSLRGRSPIEVLSNWWFLGRSNRPVGNARTTREGEKSTGRGKDKPDRHYVLSKRVAARFEEPVVLET